MKYIFKNSTYDFNIAGDPMHVTDGDFFGVWDEKNQCWDVEPDLNYHKFSGLFSVENSAKKGDYTTAKQALMEYYIPEKYNKIKRIEKPSAFDLTESEKLERNMYATHYNGSSLEILKGIGESWQTVKATKILKHIADAVRDGNPYVAFVIASMDKSSTAAEIKSRLSDCPPKLKLSVNGEEITLKACGTTHISPQKNGDTNYGGSEILYAREYGYKGHWDNFNAPWGEEASNTFRAYIKFDISSIEADDEITNPSLELTCRVQPGGDLLEKELFVYGWQDSSWSEDKLTWNSFTDWLFFSVNDNEAWDFITSSKPARKGKLCFYHRGPLLAPLANAYDGTGDERYAHNFIRQMMSLINQVGINPNVMNALDLSNHVFWMGTSFVRCWGSKYMTAEIFTAFLKHLSRMADYVCREYLEKKTHWNNWATNQTRASYWSCMAFPEFKNADFWYDCTVRHNLRLYDTGRFNDGVSVEQGLGYVVTWLSTVEGAFEVWDYIKNPVYGLFCDESGADILFNIVKNFYYSTAPGIGGFNLSDSMDHGITYRDVITRWYHHLVKMGKYDAELEYVATNGEKGVLPDFTSVSFPFANRTYFRTDWGKDAISMVITAKSYDGFGGASHHHNDALSVSLFGYGRNLLIDSSYGAVLTGDTYAYMTSAKQHNTITVNNGNIDMENSGDGFRKELFMDDEYNLVTYTHHGIEGVKAVERSLLFLKNKGLIVVFDYIVPCDDKEYNLQQYWHMLPDSGIYITDKKEFKSAFSKGANVVVSPVLTDGVSACLEDSVYAPALGSFIKNKKGVYSKKAKGITAMATVICPICQGDDISIEAMPVETGVANNGATAFCVKLRNGKGVETYYFHHLNDVEKRCDFNIGKYKTNATMLVVCEDDKGNVVSHFAYEGDLKIIS